MNWGYRVIFLYVGFIALIGTLVYYANRENIDLVSPDYYEQELKYQDRLEAAKNAALMDSSIQWTQYHDDLLLTYPVEMLDSSVGVIGKVKLFRPSDANLDVEVPLKLNTNHQQTLHVPKFKRGEYQLQINWTRAGKPFYYEKKVFLN